MAIIEYSPAAVKDLQQIRNRILSNWGDDTAKKVLKKITMDIRRLDQYPLSGANLGKLIDISTSYRYIFSEKNYVFYHVEGTNIRIVRILNERQDFLRHLFGIKTQLSDD